MEKEFIIIKKKIYFMKVNGKMELKKVMEN